MGGVLGPLLAMIPQNIITTRTLNRWTASILIELFHDAPVLIGTIPASCKSTSGP